MEAFCVRCDSIAIELVETIENNSATCRLSSAIHVRTVTGHLARSGACVAQVCHARRYVITTTQPVAWQNGMTKGVQKTM